eukprot:c10797_g1_i5.p2 GENE.c10797_g1_i5~~c10797_g1_i5.p2  ORF type:complete len:142 (-),score=25.48 c10797_g1_i5:852-1277(-)
MMMYVAVSSSNPTKIAAVTHSFRNCYQSPGLSIEILSIPSESGIPHGQPWGMQHTYEGAMTRLTNMATSAVLMNAIKEKQGDWFLVSVENGVVPIVTHTETQGHDVACVAIRRMHDGATTSAFSSSRPYPLEEVGVFCCCS